MILSPFDPALLAPIAAPFQPSTQETIVPAAARALPAEPEDPRLTPAEAVDLLPHAQTVHVLVGPIRARWERTDLAAALVAGRDHRLTLAARSAGFGLSFVRDSGESVLVQTDDAKVRGWTERRSPEAAE